MTITITLKESNKTLAEFMGFPKPTVGMKVIYDRTFCMSSTRLTIKEVTDTYISFNEETAYLTYPIASFDGKIFRPAGYHSVHYPAREYHRCWDYLMQVVEKVESEIGSVTITPKICRVEMKFMQRKRYAKEKSIDFTDVPPIAECNTGTFLENVYNCMVDAIKKNQGNL